MAQVQSWTEAYKELCLLLDSAVPEIKHKDMWYEQINFPKDDYPYPDRSLFMDIKIDQIETLAQNIQDLECTITFYFVFNTFSETYHGSVNQNTALEFVDICSKLHGTLQGLSGANFSPMDRTKDERFVTREGFLNVREMAYETIIRDYSALKEYRSHVITAIGLDDSEAPVVNWTDMYQPPTS